MSEGTPAHIEEFEVQAITGKGAWVRHTSHQSIQDALDEAAKIAYEEHWPARVVKSVLIQGFSPA